MNIRDESGYTLIETLIAMVLFVGVLLPLLGAISDLMIDREPDEKAYAQKVVQIEFSELARQPVAQSSEHTTDKGLVVRRGISSRGRIIDVTVTVSSKKADGKPLLTVCRSILRDK